MFSFCAGNKTMCKYTCLKDINRYINLVYEYIFFFTEIANVPNESVKRTVTEFVTIKDTSLNLKPYARETEDNAS